MLRRLIFLNLGLALVFSWTRPANAQDVLKIFAQLRSPDTAVREVAKVQLCSVDVKSLPALLEGLRDQNAFVRACAASALGDVGPDAPLSVQTQTVIPALVTLALGEGQAPTPAQNPSSHLTSMTSPSNGSVSVTTSCHSQRGFGGHGQMGGTPSALSLSQAQVEQDTLDAYHSSVAALVEFGTESIFGMLEINVHDPHDEIVNELINDAFARLYATAIPKLIEAIDAPNTGAPHAMGSELGLAACARLQFLKSAALPAAPAIIAHLSSLKIAGSKTLATIGVTAVEGTITAIRSADLDTQEYACRAMFLMDQLPSSADSVVPDLVKLRCGLGNLEESEDIDNLLARLDRHSVFSSILDLILRGDDSAKVQLSTCLNNVEDLRRSVRKSIASSDLTSDEDKGDNAAAVSLFSGLLHSPNANVRLAAVQGLREFGPSSLASAPQLHSLLGDQDPKVRAAVIDMLAGMGSQIMPFLIGWFKVSDDTIRAQIISVLGRLGAVAADFLVAILNDDSSSDTIHTNCNDALTSLGYGAVHALVTSIRDEGLPASSRSRLVAALAATSLSSNGLTTNNPEAEMKEEEALRFTTLSAALSDPDEVVRSSAALGFGIGHELRLGPNPRLYAAAADRSALVRRSVAVTLSKLIPTTPADRDSILAALTHAQHDEDESVRQLASMALQTSKRWGPKVLTNGADNPLPLVSLDLKDAPIRQALEQLFENAGAQFSIDNNIAGLVTLTIVDQPLENALRVLLRSSSQPLSYTRENGVFFIKPRVVTTTSDAAAPPPYADSVAAANIPTLTLPPPTPCLDYVFESQRPFFGDDSSNLSHVYNRLIKALDFCGYSDRHLFAVPSGFAIMTRPERILQDGAYAKENRWSIGNASFSGSVIDILKDYLKRLIVGDNSEFRMLVFVVTPLTYANHNSPQTLSLDDATKWFLAGGSSFPARVGRLPFKGCQCHVLIYDFAREEDTTTLTLSTLSAVQHIQKTGILAYLESEP